MLRNYLLSGFMLGLLAAVLSLPLVLETPLEPILLVPLFVTVLAVGGVGLFRILVGAVCLVSAHTRSQRLTRVAIWLAKSVPVVGLALLTFMVGILLSLECGWTNPNCSNTRGLAPIWMPLLSLLVSGAFLNRMDEAIHRFSHVKGLNIQRIEVPEEAHSLGSREP